MDAAEARLEGILGTRRASPWRTSPQLARELDALREEAGDAGLPRARGARGASCAATIALLAGDEDGGARARSTPRSRTRRKAARREWAWRALDARARLVGVARVGSRRRGETPRQRSRCSKRRRRSSRAICARSSGTIRAAARSGKRTPRRSRSPLSSAARRRGRHRRSRRDAHARRAAAGTTSLGAPLPPRTGSRGSSRSRASSRPSTTWTALLAAGDRPRDRAARRRARVRACSSNEDGELEAQRGARAAKGRRRARAVLALGGRAGRATGEPVIAERARRRRAAREGGERPRS